MQKSLRRLIFVGLVAVLVLTMVGYASTTLAKSDSAKKAKSAGFQVPKIELVNVRVAFAGKELAAIDFLFTVDNPNNAAVEISQMFYDLKVQGMFIGGNPAIAGPLYLPRKQTLTFNTTALVTANALMWAYINFKGLGFPEATEEAGKVLTAVAKLPFKLNITGTASFVSGKEEKVIPFTIEKEMTKPE